MPPEPPRGKTFHALHGELHDISLVSISIPLTIYRLDQCDAPNCLRLVVCLSGSGTHIVNSGMYSAVCVHVGKGKRNLPLNIAQKYEIVK